VPNIKILNKAVVDDQIWYTTVCSKEVVNWLKTLEPSETPSVVILDYVTGSGGSIVDMNHKIYTWCKLKWD
jgi:hypothetical protein